jgi:hypothetical protein
VESVRGQSSNRTVRRAATEQNLDANIAVFALAIGCCAPASESDGDPVADVYALLREFPLEDRPAAASCRGERHDLAAVSPYEQSRGRVRTTARKLYHSPDECVALGEINPFGGT